MSCIYHCLPGDNVKIELKTKAILYKKTLTHLDMYHRGVSGRDFTQARSQKILRVASNATVDP